VTPKRARRGANVDVAQEDLIVAAEVVVWLGRWDVQRAVGGVVWWAAFLMVACLLSDSDAREASARMSVSVTVVRPCRISLLPVPGTDAADAVVPHVDCGPEPRRAERLSFRVRVCDRHNREGWCLRLRDLHPGADVRTIRFD
jgi:hypothetical protein